MSLLEDHVSAAEFGTVTGHDEAKTVEVTTSARHRLIDLYVESGLLRLGVNTVAQRITEALRNAHAAVTANNAAATENLYEKIDEATADLVGLFGDAWPFPREPSP